MKTVEEIHEYWKNPGDGKNDPVGYLKGQEKTQFLIDIMEFLAEKDDRILEFGCNIGRNLSGLYLAGYNDLSGIEINKKAIELMDDFLFDEIVIYKGSIEEYITEYLTLKNFNITFSMAVLCHIHDVSIKSILQNSIRITKDFIITIEDEKTISDRHFPRNYKEEYEKLGIEQVCEQNCKNIPRLGKKYYLRIFKI